jgi:hypothetical protein
LVVKKPTTPQGQITPFVAYARTVVVRHHRPFKRDALYHHLVALNHPNGLALGVCAPCQDADTRPRSFDGQAALRPHRHLGGVIAWGNQDGVAVARGTGQLG